MSEGGWIGVDLDGTLAKYEDWVDELHIGEPIPAMVARIQEWLAHGREVRIFTARVGSQGRATRNVAVIEAAIQEWCYKHIGTRLPVTCCKDFAMTVLYDDRCIQVESNTGRLIGGSYLE